MERNGHSKEALGLPVEPVGATNTPPESSASGGLEAGRAFIQNIIADPPEPVPGLAEKLRKDDAPQSLPETESDVGEGIRVNPEDWKHLKDWKGRAFDPNLHKVNLDGSPTIGTKDRLQCLKKGESNPVKVFLSRFSGNEFEEVVIETQDEAHAQAQAVVDHGRLQRKARRLVNAYFTGGTVLWGLRFRKGKQKRAPALESEMVDVMLETGKELDVPPVVSATGAFICDFEEMLYLNFGENPEQGAIKKFLLRRLPFIRWFFRGKRKPEKETFINDEGAE